MEYDEEKDEITFVKISKSLEEPSQNDEHTLECEYECGKSLMKEKSKKSKMEFDDDEFISI